MGADLGGEGDGPELEADGAPHRDDAAPPVPAADHAVALIRPPARGPRGVELLCPLEEERARRVEQRPAKAAGQAPRQVGPRRVHIIARRAGASRAGDEDLRVIPPVEQKRAVGRALLAAVVVAVERRRPVHHAQLHVLRRHGRGRRYGRGRRCRHGAALLIAPVASLSAPASGSAANRHAPSSSRRDLAGSTHRGPGSGLLLREVRTHDNARPEPLIMDASHALDS